MLLFPRPVVFAFSFACFAAAAVLTPEQAIKTRNISGLTFSPDGSRLACVVSEVPKGELPHTHLWLLDVGRAEFRQLSYSAKSESAPRWSPDGRMLAFLSDRDERMQIYVIRMDGGEAAPLTSGKNAVSAFRWSPDGASIAYLAPEPPTEAEEKKEKDKDDGKIADRERDLPRLWAMDVATKKTRQLTHGAWKIEQFEWVTGDRIIAAATDQPKAEIWTNALYNVAVADGKFVLFSQPKQPFGGLTIPADRTRIAFASTTRSGPHPHDLFIQSANGGAARDASSPLDRALHAVKWRSGSTVLFSAADGFRSRLYGIAGDRPPRPIDLPYSIGDFDVDRDEIDGKIAFVGLGFNRLPELFLKSAAGVKQVSHIQAGWDGITLANAELFRFKSFDGREAEAALMKPQGAAEGGKLPLILYVHGGPAGNFSDSYGAWPQLLVAHGYQVLMVNPRGSAGYGEEFLMANRADWGGGDFKDLMAGVDAVLARGETDPARLGIGGWSYGGYMAEWAITQTNRFKAAVSGAGMFDLAAEYGTETGPEGDEWYFGTPWENPERFARSSPATYIRNAKTPTLILQGENDRTDPDGQSTALYRALKRYSVESELVVYPREPHGPHEEKHQVDILTRMLGWFDRFLKPAESKR